MIRINIVRKKLGIGKETIIGDLMAAGIANASSYTENTKLTDEEERIICDKHNKGELLSAVPVSAPTPQEVETNIKEVERQPEQQPVETKPLKPNEPRILGKIDLSKTKPKKTVAPAPTKEETASETKTEPSPKPIKARVPVVSDEIVAKSEKVKEKIAEQSNKRLEIPEPIEQPTEKTDISLAVVTPSASITEKTESEDDTISSENTTQQPAIAEQTTKDSVKGEQQKLNILGKMDLSTINNKTRPKRKTIKEIEELRKAKDEKRKAERDKNRQSRKSQGQGAQGAQGGAEHPRGEKGERREDGKRPRTRIGGAGKVKVDIEKVAATAPAPDKSRSDNRGGKDKRNDARHTKDNAKQGDKRKNFYDKQDALTSYNAEGRAIGRKKKKEKKEIRSTNEERQRLAAGSTLQLTEFVTVSELASMMGKSVNEVIGTLMKIGMMVSINQRLDEEAINIVAEEFGFNTKYVGAEVTQAIEEEEDKLEDLVSRPPIVTVMGHVDHGKTKLLDYIRSTNVVAGEAGGITQHIGAYNVKMEDGRHITFLDTPGHEAFTAMRARGAKVTDIVIVVVAADDDVMPQTKEAINHASAAGVPIVFAINKIDHPNANPDKIKEALSQMNYLVEEWGGKYQSQDISAKLGTGVKELMEKVLLEAELLDLKANPNRKATGSVIESTLDKGRGYVSTVLVSAGTLTTGDIVLAGMHYGRVKAMFNERGQAVKQAAPAAPVSILGLNGAPQAGDTFHVMSSDSEAREIANKREQLQREQALRTHKMLSLDELGRRIALGDFKELNIIVKADVDGSIEALSDSLLKLTTEQVQVNVIHKAVGQISESDISLAAASNAIIIGFNVRPSASARRQAEQDGIDIRIYSIIYDAIEEVKSAMEGLLAPEVKEQVTATVEVREVFHISKVGYVAGAQVREGKVKRADKARLIRDGIVIFNGNINALKRFKDDVKEVLSGFECGISLQGCNDIKVGDIIESYEEIEVKATL